jgi:hypothetical protein
LRHGKQGNWFVHRAVNTLCSLPETCDLLLALFSAPIFDYQQAVCISLGLEAHVFGVTHKDFFEIIEQDMAGPNKDATTEKMRTFLIPEHFIVPNSSSTRPRTIKIFAAFMSSDWGVPSKRFRGTFQNVCTFQAKSLDDDLVPTSKVSNFSCRLEYNLTLISSTGTFSSTPLKEVIGYRRNPSQWQQLRSGD